MSTPLQYYSDIKPLDSKSLIQNNNHIHQREDPNNSLTSTIEVLASSTNPPLPIAPYITFQKTSYNKPSNPPLSTEFISSYHPMEGSEPRKKCTSRCTRSQHKLLKMLSSSTPAYWTS